MEAGGFRSPDRDRVEGAQEAGVGALDHFIKATWESPEGQFPDVGMIPGCWDDWFCDIGRRSREPAVSGVSTSPPSTGGSLRLEAGTVPPGSCLRAHALGATLEPESPWPACHLGARGARSRQRARVGGGRGERGTVTRLLLVFSREFADAVSQLVTQKFRADAGSAAPPAPATKRWPGSS